METATRAGRRLPERRSRLVSGMEKWSVSQRRGRRDLILTYRVRIVNAGGAGMKQSTQRLAEGYAPVAVGSGLAVGAVRMLHYRRRSVQLLVAGTYHPGDRG